MFLLMALAFFVIALIGDSQNHPSFRPAIVVGWLCLAFSIIEFIYRFWVW